MRVVIDTNQLVASLVRSPELATFLMAWESARFTVIASADLIDEYKHVLAYPDIAKLIYPELLRMYQSHLADDIEVVETPDVPAICRDPDDDKVIATAIYGLADFILTVDRDLLTPDVIEALGEVGIQVLSSGAMLRLLDTSAVG